MKDFIRKDFIRKDFSGSHQSSRPTFVLRPTSQDYQVLAQHVSAAPPETLHSALQPKRAEVAQRLRQMGERPEQEAHQAAYQALRLLVW